MTHLKGAQPQSRRSFIGVVVIALFGPPKDIEAQRVHASGATVLPLRRSADMKLANIPQTLTVMRSAESSECTTGYVAVDGTHVCYSLELPDANNAKYFSRIPKGTYDALLRYDHADGWRVELKEVPGRDNVQFHIGNWPYQTQGCVLVGRTVDVAGCAVGESAAAYQALRAALYGDADPASVATVFDLRVEISGL